MSPGQRPPRPPEISDPRIIQLVAAISEERLGVILKKLESFETRSTLSSTDSPTRGIGAARQWILDEMKGYSPKLQVSFDTYQVAKQGRITRDVELRNVMAILPGRSPRRIYISGHYDTLARAGGQGASNAGGTGPARSRRAGPGEGDPNAPLDNLAPGVNDDGSGTALTIELARVFSQSGIDFDATLVFMCHVAEEQGLVGARLHAQKAVAEKIPIEAVLNNDIVGNDRGGNGIVDGATIRVYSEGPEDSPSRAAGAVRAAVGRPLRAVAQSASDGAARPFRPRRRPFRLQPAGIHRGRLSRIAREFHPAARRARHLSKAFRLPYLAQNARVNAAAAATLALAPPRSGGDERPRPAAHLARTVRLRREPEMDGVAGRSGLPDLLARSLGARLAARHAGRQCHRIWCCRTSRLTTTFSASRRLTRPGTRASSTAYVAPPRANTAITEANKRPVSRVQQVQSAFRLRARAGRCHGVDEVGDDVGHAVGRLDELDARAV